MKVYFKSAMIVLAAIAVVFALDFIGNAWGLWSYTFWGAKQEAARYNVHKHSQVYIDGMNQQIADAAEQWPQLNDEQRMAIRGLLRSRLRDFDKSEILPDLVPFYETSIKGNE